MLDTGDFLLIPPELAPKYRRHGDDPDHPLHRKPVRFGDEFIDRAKRAGQPIA